MQAQKEIDCTRTEQPFSRNLFGSSIAAYSARAASLGATRDDSSGSLAPPLASVLASRPLGRLHNVETVRLDASGR